MIRSSIAATAWTVTRYRNISRLSPLSRSRAIKKDLNNLREGTRPRQQRPFFTFRERGIFWCICRLILRMGTRAHEFPHPPAHFWSMLCRRQTCRAHRYPLPPHRHRPLALLTGHTSFLFSATLHLFPACSFRLV